MKLRLALLSSLSLLVNGILTSPASAVESRAATPKLVFAHFMVGVVDGYTTAKWTADIQLAQQTGIDAFALNIGLDNWTNPQLANAYSAAQSAGFKLFISFDFGAAGWTQGDIVPILNTYAGHPAQLQWGNGALVSTFIGDGFDWTPVKSAVNHALEVIPNYQASQAHQLGTDGLFQWNAWPSQNNQPINHNMTTDGDNFYISQLAGSPYMANVSPWFFTHYAPTSFNKNWIYLSDTLFIDRWNEILNLQPQLVELTTWNDFGESHYIGPLHPEMPSVYAPNGEPTGAIEWSAGFPHDAWRKIIKPYIAAYKNTDSVLNHITAADETVVFWYRPHSKGLACTQDTVGPPTGRDFTIDGVWAAPIIATDAQLTIAYGTNVVFNDTVKAGINYYAASMLNGAPTFTLSRNGVVLSSATGGKAISTQSCDFYNFNAFVGSTTA